jgi:signal peptidase I
MGLFTKKPAPKQEPLTFLGQIWSWIKTFVWALSVVTIVNGLILASFVVPTGSMESTVMTGEFLFVNKLKYGPSTPQIIPFFNIPLPYYKLPPLWAPKIGDVIVFVFPGNRDQAEPDNFEYYLKRCVATAGDTLQVKGGRVFVNGKELGLPEHAQFYNMPPEARAQKAIEDAPRTFPKGRNYSADDWGPIRIPKEGDVIQLTQANIGEWATFIRREGHDVDEIGLRIDGKAVSSYTVERDYVFGMGDNRDNSLDSRFWGFIPEHDVVGTPMFVYWSWETKEQVVIGGRIIERDLSIGQKLARIRWSRLGSIIL